MSEDLPPDFLAKLHSITAKRAKTVIDHILAHGFITTEDLKVTYGYNHPPRAICDVKEHGIPIETYKVTGSDGRRMAAYKFADPSLVRGASHAGRTTFSKPFKQLLIETHGARCAICSAKHDSRYLQIDHRVPYAVAGDSDDLTASEFMLVCQSCNRAKSWSCEHCQNWLVERKPDICRTCYWANPDKYAHIALELIRRLDVVWTGEEVPEYEKLKELSEHAQQPLPDYVKAALREVGKS